MALFNPTPIQTELVKLPSISDQYAMDPDAAYTPSKPPPPPPMESMRCRPGNWSVQATPVNEGTPVHEFSHFSASGDTTSFACSNNEFDDSSSTNKVKLLAADHDECESHKSFRTISASTSASTEEQEAYTESDITRIADQVQLQPHGLVIVDVVAETMAGCVYEAQLQDGDAHAEHESKQSVMAEARVVNGIPLYRRTSSLKCFSAAASSRQPNNAVCITKVDKCGLQNSGSSSITKECLILHYLTVLNRPPAENITPFVDFIETELAYYLVRASEPSYISLSEFVEQAHLYIGDQKLKLKHWRITAKFIFWQLISTLYWLHCDMKTCLLQLDAQHILVGNANFLVSKQDGAVQIDSRQLNVKLTQFAHAEVFADQGGPFLCHKSESSSDRCRAPQAHSGQIFDARKDDTYQLGVLLFQLLTGSGVGHDAYAALQQHTFKHFVESNGLGRHITRDALSLLESLLNIDEEERLDAKQTIAHAWLQHYHARYKTRIQQKSKSQQQRHVRQKKKVAMLPFYALPSNTKHCSL